MHQKLRWEFQENAWADTAYSLVWAENFVNMLKERGLYGPVHMLLLDELTSQMGTVSVFVFVCVSRGRGFKGEGGGLIVVVLVCAIGMYLSAYNVGADLQRLPSGSQRDPTLHSGRVHRPIAACRSSLWCPDEEDYE